MLHNSTVDAQINHRSIRKFKDEVLNKEQLETLYTVFQHTATSMFMQNASLLHVTDPEQKKKIQELCNQKYVGAEGDLFIFIVDCTVINKFVNNLVKMMAVFIRLISFSKLWKIRCLPFKMWLMR